MSRNSRGLMFALSLAALGLVSTASAQEPAKSKFDTIIEGAKKVDAPSMWPMYYKDQQLLVDLPAAHLNQNFIILTSIARGISQGMVLGGMTWSDGDEVIWSFRKVGDKMHVLRRNVRFRAKDGSPEANAVKLAYSDSILYALPILTATPTGGSLIDMTRIFMSDDQQIGRSIGPGFSFASDRSTWAKVKGYPQNIELQVAAVYAGGTGFDTVADPRGVQVNVHYSISLLPNNGYKPRKADDRIGYFLTVLKDFSDKDDDQQFVRYINRWNLQKADPAATLSPPKEPIIFYIEKTVPINLRPVVRAGIEEWNKAFEKLGFANAIEVRQQRDDDDWDPEDIRYNTFRWITADAGFAMGPSRVNPMTGQILDADIIFDAGFLQYWKTDYETFTPADAAALIGGAPLHAQHPLALPAAPEPHFHLPGTACTYCKGMQQQMGFAAAVLHSRGVTEAGGKLPEEFIMQGLKEVVMHEVGHTLGLRHNFKASSWKTLEEMADPVKGREEGTVASVMDYSPPNIAPKGATQGLYYSQTIGPYDTWAIEYGYKPVTGDENAELAKIAARSAEPGLDYATDEDTRGIDPDPLVNRFDLGKNPIDFSRRQMALTTELLPQVLDRTVKDGEGYQRARQAFGMIFGEYWRTAAFASRIPGGVYVHRDHKGDANGRPPLKLVEPEQQRAAMKLLNETAFGPQNYPPELLNYLATTRWSHWGINSPRRLDYAIHEFVEMMQGRLLAQVLHPLTLSRVHDGELKVAVDAADVYTLPEHLRLVTDGIFSEWKAAPAGEYTNRKPLVSSFRRNLQRLAVKELAWIITTSSSGAPEDARTLARMHLSDLDAQITAVLGKADVKLDDYSRAHLVDCQARIRKVLEASVNLNSID